MSTYIAITIGPIFQTMSLSSSPAALWLTSYMFSMLSKAICQQLVAKGVNEEDIVTPYYSKNYFEKHPEKDIEEDLLNKNDGVGLFHDRIIFKSENFELQNVNVVKNEAIKNVAEQFGVNAEYLQSYVMVEALKFETESPILESSAILDSLELATPFVYSEEQNPLLELFSGNEGAKNQKIKNTKVFDGITKTQFQLLKENGNIKSLEDIANSANSNENMKKYKYYAIVRSDGDNMGKIIEELKTDEDIREFSKTCLSYCSSVAEKVKEFGGVTIYSGGDDLLAILPCENPCENPYENPCETKDYQTPFDFVKEANKIFNSKFSSYGNEASLSFGITMAYYKYPLYEALEDSAKLLFGVAKQTKEKNCFAIRLQKHAGQSEGLIIPNKSLECLNKKMGQIRKCVKEEQVFFSALHKLVLFEKAFNNVSNEAECKNLFKNVFDGPEHNNDFISKYLPELFWWLKNESEINAITDEKIEEKNTALICAYLLRIIKFYFEKGGEE